MDLEFQSYFSVVPAFKSCQIDFVPCPDLVTESIGRTNGGKHLVSKHHLR